MPLLNNSWGCFGDDDELFLWYGWRTKGVQPYFQPRLLSEILNSPSGFEPAQNLSWGLVEWSCAVEITTTSDLDCFHEKTTSCAFLFLSILEDVFQLYAHSETIWGTPALTGNQSDGYPWSPVVCPFWNYLRYTSFNWQPIWWLSIKYYSLEYVIKKAVIMC